MRKTTGFVLSGQIGIFPQAYFGEGPGTLLEKKYLEGGTGIKKLFVWSKVFFVSARPPLPNEDMGFLIGQGPTS
jgi:hypothetical protein